VINIFKHLQPFPRASRQWWSVWPSLLHSSWVVTSNLWFYFKNDAIRKTV
jgi:hypothetical protein